ncbi:MAG TPA: SgcJ/EcaC family oxidoreductase [Gemmataceae bacterium]|jgi:uncharacterized protein (TIGR02246 family)|nr:SgcJ/EcaC family oxidoreductase [Gemmataceae bacterium]
MYRKGIVLLGAFAMAFVGLGFMTAQDKAGKGPDREADKQAIDRLVKASVQAFNDRDAAAIAANWTEEGEYVRNDGVPVHGRAEIQKGYAEFFKTLKGKPTLDLQTDNLRFTSADTALSEVTLRLKNEQGQLIASSWRNTLLVREGGQWKVALVQEWDRDSSMDDDLKDLDWLIGTWRMDVKDREATIAYAWDENKAFIRGTATVKQGGKVVESGTHVLAKDNADGGIRSWVFQSDGGFGDGLWTRDGKNWSVDFGGVTPDGKRLAATVQYVRVNADTFTWQAVQQTVDGQPIADTPPIRVTKQKADR